MLEITRPLIEQYLLATGCSMFEEHEHRYWRFAGGCSLPAIGNALSMVNLIERRIDAEIRFKLGVCMIAESMIRNVDAYHGRLSDTGASIMQQVRTALDGVGISLEVWEAAQKETT